MEWIAESQVEEKRMVIKSRIVYIQVIYIHLQEDRCLLSLIPTIRLCFNMYQGNIEHIFEGKNVFLNETRNQLIAFNLNVIFSDILDNH